MNLIVFKAGYEKVDKYKRTGMTDARINNLDAISNALSLYAPPISMVFPAEQLSSQHQQISAGWRQVVLCGASPKHSKVGTEDQQLATYRAMLSSSKLVITMPFKDVASFMIDHNFEKAPLQLRAATNFLEPTVTQNNLKDMVDAGVKIRKAVVEDP